MLQLKSLLFGLDGLFGKSVEALRSINNVLLLVNSINTSLDGLRVAGAGLVQNTRDFLRLDIRNKQTCVWNTRSCANCRVRTAIVASAQSLYGVDTLRPRSVAKIKKPARMTVSSLATYNSFDTPNAVRPAPRVTHVVLEMRLLPGRESMIEDALASGDGSNRVRVVSRYPLGRKGTWRADQTDRPCMCVCGGETYCQSRNVHCRRMDGIGNQNMWHRCNPLVLAY